MTVDPDTDRFMTVKEVATFFAVKEITVRQWLKDGTMKGLKGQGSSHWRILRSEVIRYAQKEYGSTG